MKQKEMIYLVHQTPGFEGGYVDSISTDRFEHLGLTWERGRDGMLVTREMRDEDGVLCIEESLIPWANIRRVVRRTPKPTPPAPTGGAKR